LRQAGRRKGVTIHPPSADVQAKVDAFIRQVAVDGAAASATKFGIAEADKVVAKITELNAKWDRIWKESGGDLSKFKARVRDEVVAKVDTATYFAK
jgi:hypothetical protein